MVRVSLGATPCRPCHGGMTRADPVVEARSGRCRAARQEERPEAVRVALSA
jgi:hypothetical protein